MQQISLDLVDARLDALRASDAILAALQATFAIPTLIDGRNPFLFIPNDPAASKIWICDPESKLLVDRAGSRPLILVERLDYQPSNLHLMNYGGGDFNDVSEFSDLGITSVVAHCEAGSKYASEILASIVYQALKRFRLDIMREFHIHAFNVLGVSRPIQVEQGVGSPWITDVTIRVETQERFTVIDVANRLSAVEIRRIYEDNQRSRKTVSAVRLE